jgi:hypothetical protein
MRFLFALWFMSGIMAVAEVVFLLLSIFVIVANQSHIILARGGSDEHSLLGFVRFLFDFISSAWGFAWGWLVLLLAALMSFMRQRGGSDGLGLPGWFSMRALWEGTFLIVAGFTVVWIWAYFLIWEMIRD